MHMIALIAMNLPLDARIRFLKHLAYGDYFLLLPNFIHFIVEISLRFLSSTKINGSKNMLISLHDFVVFDFILFGQHCKVLCVHSQRIFEVEDENFWHYHKIPQYFFYCGTIWKYKIDLLLCVQSSVSFAFHSITKESSLQGGFGTIRSKI